MSQKNKPTYTWKNVGDKSPEGFKHEINRGLAIHAAYLNRTFGLPVEITRDYFKDIPFTTLIHGYFIFRNEHPELFVKREVDSV